MMKKSSHYKNMGKIGVLGSSLTRCILSDKMRILRCRGGISRHQNFFFSLVSICDIFFQKTPLQQLSKFLSIIYPLYTIKGRSENKMTQRLTLTINEAAEYSGIGRNTLRALVNWKKIPVIRVGNKIVIRTQTLDQFLLLNEGKNLKNKQEVIALQI